MWNFNSLCQFPESFVRRRYATSTFVFPDCGTNLIEQLIVVQQKIAIV